MKRPADWRALSFMAGGLGFEPRLTESEYDGDPGWREQTEDGEGFSAWRTASPHPTDPIPNRQREKPSKFWFVPTRSTAYRNRNRTFSEPLAVRRGTGSGVTFVVDDDASLGGPAASGRQSPDRRVCSRSGPTIVRCQIGRWITARIPDCEASDVFARTWTTPSVRQSGRPSRRS
jgi:hypothetical protein